MNQVIMRAYADEFEKIASVDKQAFLGKILPFLGKGLKQWGALTARTGNKKGIMAMLGAQAKKSGGYGALAKEYAPALTTAGIGGLGLYGGGKLLFGRGRKGDRFAAQ